MKNIDGECCRQVRCQRSCTFFFSFSVFVLVVDARTRIAMLEKKKAKLHGLTEATDPEKTTSQERNAARIIPARKKRV